MPIPIPILLPFLLVGAPPDMPEAPPVAGRLSALTHKLREGPGPVRVVVLGDSLTAGWGVADPERDPFCRLFQQALQARYTSCAIEVIAAGGPGDPSDLGVLRADHEVVRRRPDVVVLQFGGNDERLHRSPADLTNDLIRLIGLATSPPVNALCVVATPPMNDAEANSPFVRAAAAAAAAEGVPLADFDGALRREGRDFRGPFCWGAHPGSFTHVLMARELLAAWDRMLGSKPRLSVRLAGYTTMLRDPGQAPLEVSARNLGEADLDADLECGSGAVLARSRTHLAGGQDVKVAPGVTLPTLGRSRRTQTLRLSALGRSAEVVASDFDVKWLSMAPVVTPDVVDDVADPAKLTWHRLGADSIVLGQDAWEGDGDLSARFALAQLPGALVLLVEVTDDVVHPASPRAATTDGDAVEVFLDRRGAADQGSPVYSPDVVALLVRPIAGWRGETIWAPLDKANADRLRGVSLSSERTAHGYSIRVTFPDELLRRAGESDYTGMGFDLGVDDADDESGRKCQLMWAGNAHNYLNPSAFGALAAPSPVPPQWRATLR